MLSQLYKQVEEDVNGWIWVLTLGSRHQFDIVARPAAWYRRKIIGFWLQSNWNLIMVWSESDHNPIEIRSRSGWNSIGFMSNCSQNLIEWRSQSSPWLRLLRWILAAIQPNSGCDPIGLRVWSDRLESDWIAAKIQRDRNHGDDCDHHSIEFRS